MRLSFVLVTLLLGGCASPRAQMEPVGVTEPGCGVTPVLREPRPPEPPSLAAGRSVLGTDASSSPELAFGPEGTTLTVGERVFRGPKATSFQGSVTRAELRADDGEPAVVVSWDTGTRLCGEVRIAEHAPVRGVWLHGE